MKWIVATGILVAVGTFAYAWWRGGEESSAIGEPLVLGERHHRVIAAQQDGAPLLVLLHERGGSPRGLLWPELVDALEAQGADRPAVLLVDGGDHSYYHDREDFDWGTHILREAIPAARERLGTDPDREAIGGFSMGGFGALDLARQRRFCAVGGHSPALWEGGGQTPEGAFDDAEDFERHDVLEAAQANPNVFRGAEVWLDVGLDDAFRRTTALLGAVVDSPAKTPPGEHGTAYWREHVDEYLEFYAEALRECA
ncbi:MAG TPA: alpha/beta hydrolase-fold protein [Gaiellaceae bacterium]